MPSEINCPYPFTPGVRSLLESIASDLASALRILHNPERSTKDPFSCALAAGHGQLHRLHAHLVQVLAADTAVLKQNFT